VSKKTRLDLMFLYHPTLARRALTTFHSTRKTQKACAIEEFQLDMGATEFGVCLKCGWKKADHTHASDTPAPAPRPVSVRQDGPKEPCANYKLDVNADTFGVCVCGFPRQAHQGQSGQTAKVSKTLERRWAQVKM